MSRNFNCAPPREKRTPNKVVIRLLLRGLEFRNIGILVLKVLGTFG